MRDLVIITGALGFIGRHTAARFSQNGYDVWGIGRGDIDPSESWGIERWVRADITLEALRQFERLPSIVVHCAGGGSVGNSLLFPRQDFACNVETTSHVLEYIRTTAPTASFVHLSSAAVYGSRSKGPIDESAEGCPVSPYGVHKSMAEAMIRMYCENFGMRASILRFFSVYGKGLRKQLLWDGSHKLLQASASFFGTGDEMRDWIHVEDAASLIETAAHRASADCPIVNGGTGIATSNRDLIQRLSGYHPNSGKFSFSGETRPGDPAYLVADSVKARAWGWAPQIELTAGLVDYINWFGSL